MEEDDEGGEVQQTPEALREREAKLRRAKGERCRGQAGRGHIGRRLTGRKQAQLWLEGCVVVGGC